jgi:hypothetical protein
MQLKTGNGEERPRTVADLRTWGPPQTTNNFHSTEEPGEKFTQIDADESETYCPLLSTLVYCLLPDLQTIDCTANYTALG